MRQTWHGSLSQEGLDWEQCLSDPGTARPCVFASAAYEKITFLFLGVGSRV